MLLDDDELKKYLLKMDREYGSGLDQAPGPHQTGTGGWRDIVQDQLNADQFGPNLPRGLGLLESREQAQQVLGHELVDNTGQHNKILKNMMRSGGTGGAEYAQMPEGGIGGGSIAGLSPWQGYSTSPDDPAFAGTKIPFPYQGTNELSPQINALYSQMDPNRLPYSNLGSPHEAGEGVGSGTPMAFDDPSIAGTRIIDHPRFNSYAGNLEPSPLQMRAMQEQIGGPGFWDAPRFAGANEPMMDDKIRYSDRSDPNFNAPMSFHGGSPSGLLSSEVTPTNKGGKWEKTPEGNDSIYRRNRRLQGYKGIMDLGARITGGPTRWR